MTSDSPSYLLVDWQGDSHFANGPGMSSAAVVCVLSDRPNEDFPKRGSLPTYTSFNKPTCRYCLQVEWDFDHYQDNDSINPYL